MEENKKTKGKFTIRRYLVWIPSLIWMSVIFTFSSRQSVSVSGEYWLDFVFFKSIHIAEYAILTFLNMFALVNSNPKSSLQKNGIYSVILAILFATSDEYHQTFVPTRQGKHFDVLVDSVGIFSVYCITVHYEKIKRSASSLFRSWQTQ